MERLGISKTGAASRTAMITACGRGSHLLMHGPRAVLKDWLAWPFVGSDAEALTAGMRAAFGDSAPLLATWVAARSRFAEGWLSRSGAEQYVILGAGLDSFGWRHTGGMRVFEVDHPATQEWKRSRLESLGLPTPPQLVWVPVDFEVESLADGLARAGVGWENTFVSWLGVVPYLSLEAVEATLRDLPPCSLAVSHGVPEVDWPIPVRAVSQTFSAIATDAGEAPASRFTPEQFAALLAGQRFMVVEEAGFEAVEPRYGLPALSIANERIVLAAKSG
jgi:methyltransferase (TIGR00027 family)